MQNSIVNSRESYSITFTKTLLYMYISSSDRCTRKNRTQASFFQMEIEEVSSAIVVSKDRNWEAFAQPNFGPPKIVLEAGKWYESISDAFPGFNDVIKSVRKE